MKLVSLAIQRPITNLMFWVTVILFGFVAFQRLAIDLLPDISYPTLTVRTEYLGTAPSEMENLISIPIEESVGVVSGVIRVSSISKPGVSDVIVEFEWGTNMDFASLDVREKLDLLQLPEDVRKPVILRYDPSLEPIMRMSLHGEMDLMALREMGEEEIKQDFESIEGVAAVKVSGGLEEEIQVELDVQKLASINIPIPQVTARLAQENINLTGGSLKDGNAEYLVRTLNEFRNIDEINKVVIGIPRGVPVLLSEVGQVKRGFRERTIITRLGAEESVEVAIYKEAGSNTVQVANIVKERVTDLKDYLSKLPRPVKLDIVTDQSTFIRQSIDEVLTTAYIGGILAIIILYLFLRNLKSTMIISLSIPLSIVATFFLMYVFKVSLNIMSLGGLALGIGKLVDDSIVALESINRVREEEGLSDRESAEKGTSIVGIAISASTLTTVCVFIPIIFVKGVAGQLFADQALTVTFSLLASWVVAITLIPMLYSISVSKEDENNNELDSGTDRNKPQHGKIGLFVLLAITPLLRSIRATFQLFGRIFLWFANPVFFLFNKSYGLLETNYPPILHYALRNRLKVIFGLLSLFLISLYGLRYIGTELIPEMSQGEFYVGVKLPVGTPLEITDRTIREMSTIVEQDPRVQMVYTIAGSSSEEGSTADEEREHIGQINVLLHKGQTREEEVLVMESLREKFRSVPGIEPPKFRRPSFFSFRTPVEVEINGYNLTLLKQLANGIAEKMRNIPGLADVKSSMEGGNPEIQIVFNREKVASMGASVNSIATLVRNKVLGDIASKFSRQDRRIDIRVRALEADRKNITDLERLIVNPAGAVPVTLASVADLKIEQGPSEIRRIDQQRVALVSANLKGRDLGSVAGDIQQVIANTAVPNDFSITIGGQNEEMATSFNSLIFAMVLAVFLVYLVMASQFESLLQPFVLMFAIPFSITGVIIALLIFHLPISVVVLIGVIMLAGIVTNNGILLIDYVNHLRKQGISKNEALLEAGKVRLRPIMMTTLTAILGLLPMGLGIGEGAEVRAPMAITVIAGLSLSTFFTLVFVPTLYALLDRRK